MRQNFSFNDQNSLIFKHHNWEIFVNNLSNKMTIKFEDQKSNYYFSIIDFKILERLDILKTKSINEIYEFFKNSILHEEIRFVKKNEKEAVIKFNNIQLTSSKQFLEEYVEEKTEMKINNLEIEMNKKDEVIKKIVEEVENLKNKIQTIEIQQKENEKKNNKKKENGKKIVRNLMINNNLNNTHRSNYSSTNNFLTFNNLDVKKNQTGKKGNDKKNNPFSQKKYHFSQKKNNNKQQKK